MKPGPVDRDAVWGACRNTWRRGSGKTGWCERGYVTPLTDPRDIQSMGDGYFRRCMFCGFVWREDWVMRLVRPEGES